MKRKLKAPNIQLPQVTARMIYALILKDFSDESRRKNNKMDALIDSVPIWYVKEVKTPPT